MRLLWIFENFLHLSLQIDQAVAASQFSDATSWTSSPSLWTSLLLLLASSFFPTFSFSFSLFYPAVNLNAKFWNLWSVMGSEKTSLHVHFLPIQMVKSLTWPIFFIPFNCFIVIVFNSKKRKKKRCNSIYIINWLSKKYIL